MSAPDSPAESAPVRAGGGRDVLVMGAFATVVLVTLLVLTIVYYAGQKHSAFLSPGEEVEVVRSVMIECDVETDSIAPPGDWTLEYDERGVEDATLNVALDEGGHALVLLETLQNPVTPPTLPSCLNAGDDIPYNLTD